ncbi:MAG: hypothetical protein COB83_03645 [Gammaproteobacteria bacterium]|nr:MAG: hypothetical protein COB83_03645 [Gammaproteobacteria bacterium]
MKKLTLNQLYLQFIRTKRFYRSRYKSTKKHNNKSYLLAVKNRSIISKAKIEHLDAYKKISLETIRLKIKNRQDTFKVKVPKVFSMYDAPENVLNVINEIALLTNYPHIKIIDIDHSSCIKHDLAAEILLASAVMSLRSFKTKNSAKFRIKGTFPQDEKMCRLMRSIGIVNEIGSIKYQIRDKDKLRLFKRESTLTEKLNIFGKDKKTRATEDFTDHLNSCLSFINAKLDKLERDKIDKYLGEVLGNAEEHSGKKLWHIVGYLDAHNPDDIYTEIVIYNIGKSIKDTFDDKTDVPIVYDALIEYINKHNHLLNDEQLTMVHALQQNRSSKKTIEAIDRGQGTKYLIDLFHYLSDECNRINTLQKVNVKNGKPTMFILSGGAMLKFDGKYLPPMNDDEKMVYAFNKTNDLDIAPDMRYTPALKKSVFPGTVIYIKFPLHQKSIGLVN